MTTRAHYLYKLLPLVILSIFAFSTPYVQAQDQKVDSLLKCLSTAKTIPAKADSIAVSVIKQDNFDAEKLKHHRFKSCWLWTIITRQPIPLNLRQCFIYS